MPISNWTIFNANYLALALIEEMRQRNSATLVINENLNTKYKICMCTDLNGDHKHY